MPPPGFAEEGIHFIWLVRYLKVDQSFQDWDTN